MSYKDVFRTSIKFILNVFYINKKFYKDFKLFYKYKPLTYISRLFVYFCSFFYEWADNLTIHEIGFNL